MDLLIAWVLFPLVVLAVTAGWGLLLERASARPLPGALLVPLGLAAVVVVSQGVVFLGLGWAAAPVAAAAGLAGLVLGRARLRVARPDPWLLAAAGALYALLAAPIVLSGQATFAGYTLLGDTSVHFVLTDRLMQEGMASAGHGASSYTAMSHAYLSTAYPTGAHTALGALRPLVGQDVAWVYQPFLALIVVATGLSLWTLMGGIGVARPLRALAVLLAGAPGLVYAYYLQGSVKELAAVWILALAVALVAGLVRAGPGTRAVIPLAVTTAAGAGLLSLSLAPWLGPVIGAGALALLWSGGLASWRSIVAPAAAYAALVLALSLAAIRELPQFLVSAQGVVTSAEEMGNLLAPLRLAQAAGIWPAGDYRLGIDGTTGDVGFALIGVAVVAAALGILWLVRRAAWAPLLFLAASAIGSAYAISRGSPWADGKALMILSPAVTLAGVLGAAGLVHAGRRAEAGVIAACLAGGILWTNAHAYHKADIAPRDRLEELADLGPRLAGQGPTLYTEFEEFSKHFLRDGDPTGASESYKPEPSRMGDGDQPRFGFSHDLDELDPGYVQQFRSLVIRRSPRESRPPSNYRLTWTGDFYEHWQRAPGSEGAVTGRLTLNGLVQPGAVPDCSEVAALAAEAEAGAELAYAERPRIPVLLPTRAKRSPSFYEDGSDFLAVRPSGPGSVEGEIEIERPGRHRVWVEGSFGRRIAIYIDERRVGETEPALSPRRGYQEVGAIDLEPGRVGIGLVRPGGSPRPGDGGGNRLLGPVLVVPEDWDRRAVERLATGRWRELCGRRLDWVEVVLPGGAAVTPAGQQAGRPTVRDDG